MLLTEPAAEDSGDHGSNHGEKQEDKVSLDDFFTPILSSSAPELQGEWREVKHRMRERKRKRVRLLLALSYASL